MSEQLLGNIGSASRTRDIESRTSAIVRNLSLQNQKINSILSLLYGYNSSTRGGVLSGTDSRYTMPINHTTEPGIKPLVEGIDGTSIYTYSSATLQGSIPSYLLVHPIFYKQDVEDPTSHRPNTIYETFVALLQHINTRIDSVESTVIVESGSADSCITDCAYTKSVIGTRAFSPGGAIESGSIMERLARTMLYVEQLKHATFGNNFALDDEEDVSYELHSLSEKVDALLRLHNGNEYLANYEISGDVELSHDSAGGGCRVQHVEFFPSHTAEKLYKNNDDILIPLPANQYTITDIEDFFADGKSSSPISNSAPVAPYWYFEQTDPENIGTATSRVVLHRWMWDLDSSSHSQRTDNSKNSAAWNLQSPQRSKVTLQTPVTFSVMLQQELSSRGQYDMYIDNERLFMYWEITLFGYQNGSNEIIPMAKYSWSATDDREDHPYTCYDTANTEDREWYIRTGVNKMCMLKDIRLIDFDWNPSWNHTSPYVTLESGNSHNVCYAVITIMTKAGDDIQTTYAETNEEFLDTWGSLSVVGCEIKYDNDCTAYNVQLETSVGMLVNVNASTTSTIGAQEYIAEVNVNNARTSNITSVTGV